MRTLVSVIKPSKVLVLVEWKANDVLVCSKEWILDWVLFGFKQSNKLSKNFSSSSSLEICRDLMILSFATLLIKFSSQKFILVELLDKSLILGVVARFKIFIIVSISTTTESMIIIPDTIIKKRLVSLLPILPLHQMRPIIIVVEIIKSVTPSMKPKI